MDGRRGPRTHKEGRLSGESTMDRSDLEREIETLHPLSFAWSLGCCRYDHTEAEDVLQETYVKIFEGKARFEGRSTLKTWLFSVIRRTAASRRRVSWLRTLRFVAGDLDAVESAGESAEKRVLRSERTAALLGGIGRLSRRQREVIELVFYHEMTVEDAARVAGVSVGTARVHYARGKRRLAEELQREETR